MQALESRHRAELLQARAEANLSAASSPWLTPLQPQLRSSHANAASASSNQPLEAQLDAMTPAISTENPVASSQNPCFVSRPASASQASLPQVPMEAGNRIVSSDDTHPDDAASAGPSRHQQVHQNKRHHRFDSSRQHDAACARYSRADAHGSDNSSTSVHGDGSCSCGQEDGPEISSPQAGSQGNGVTHVSAEQAGCDPADIMSSSSPELPDCRSSGQSRPDTHQRHAGFGVREVTTPPPPPPPGAASGCPDVNRSFSSMTSFHFIR